MGLVPGSRVWACSAPPSAVPSVLCLPWADPAGRAPLRLPVQSTETPLENPRSIVATFLAGSQSSLLSLQPLSCPALLAVGDGGDFCGLGWSGEPQRADGSLGCGQADVNLWGPGRGSAGCCPPALWGPGCFPCPVPAAFGPALVSVLSEPSTSAFPQCHLAATSPRLGHAAGRAPLAGGSLASAASREAAAPGGRRSIPTASPALVPGCGAPSGAGRGGAAARRLPQSYKEMPEPAAAAAQHYSPGRRTARGGSAPCVMPLP